jgi:hypothetical protein
MLLKSPFESFTILITIFFQNAKNNAIDFKQNLQEKNVFLSTSTCSFDQSD